MNTHKYILFTVRKLNGNILPEDDCELDLGKKQSKEIAHLVKEIEWIWELCEQYKPQYNIVLDLSTELKLLKQRIQTEKQV